MARPAACDRARTWASLRLDGELSELERALLETHLGRCVDCRTAVDGIEGATQAIRSAPLVPLAVAPSVPRVRARGSLRAFYAAAGSTVAGVCVLTTAGFLAAAHIVARGDAPPKLHHVSAVASGMSEDVQLLAHIRVLRNERPVPGRIVWPA